MDWGPAPARWARCFCWISRKTGAASETLRAGQEEVRLRGGRPDTMVEARNGAVEPSAFPSRSRGDLQQLISSSLMTISCRHPLSSNSHYSTSIKEKHLMSSTFRRRPYLPPGTGSLEVGTRPTVSWAHGMIIAHEIATGTITGFRVIFIKGARYPGAAQTVMMVFPREKAGRNRYGRKPCSIRDDDGILFSSGR